MKIAYVCYWFLLERDGVANKITAQVRQWRELGHDAEVFCLQRTFGETRGSRSDWRTVRFSGLRGRYTATSELAEAVERWRPDAVYLRYDLFLPPLLPLLRRRPTVIELNTVDSQEAKLRRRNRRLARVYNAANRHALLRRARGLVCVTHEVAEAPDYAFVRASRIVIANGVDFDVVRPLPPAGASRPRVAFLGSAGQVWHGIDKLVSLAEQLPEIEFDVVGYDDAQLEASARRALPANVTAHGVLGREQYEPVLAACDAAIGTLALHRKRMTEACPLKVREYLGYGVPALIAYDDTDLRGVDAWWLKRIPNTEDNVDRTAAEIGEWIVSVRGRRVPRDDVAPLVSTQAKEPARVAFISSRAAPER
jgi:glycosyltransferase involved in cell wall biosynthesis